MKECKGLTSYLSDTMESDKKTRFEAHLTDCEKCSAAVRKDMALSTALSEVPKVNAPARFVVTVMQEVAAMRQSRFAWGVYGVAVLLMAALTGVLLGGNVSNVAGQATAVVHSLADFGTSLYTALHNISAVLFGTLPLGRMAPAVAGSAFLALCFIFYKTAFGVSTGRR